MAKSNSNIQKAPPPSREDAVIAEYLLETFRLTSAVLAATDAMSHDLGLSSARWQVLSSARDHENEPRTVSDIARRLGLRRQGIQRIADDLEKQGFVEYRDNPRHRSANILALTAKGRSTLSELNSRRLAWTQQWAPGLDLETISEMNGTMRKMRHLIQAADSPALKGDRAKEP